MNQIRCSNYICDNVNRKHLNTLTALTCFFISFLWIGTINGQGTKEILVIDRVNNKPISNATCILILKRDSSLLTTGRTNGLGKLKVNLSHPNDSVNLWILHSKFVESYGSFNPMDTQFLLPKNKVIKEVIVTGNKAITISGDTITYVADSFKLQEGANVEALLKKLPGLQVDKDGTIKAYGKKVERVLVDGDDFFGEDATLATRNLDAKMIDKVEVIDDISKKEKSTGVKDDEKVKVINLKLKESAKKGYFGKLIAGYSNTNRYDGGLMANLFTKKFKTTAYSLLDNINSRLSWEDRQQFNLGNNWYYDSDLDEYVMNEDLSNFNTYQVIPKNLLFGTNVSQQFLENSGKIFLGYKRSQKDYLGNQRFKSEQFYGVNSRKNSSLNTINSDKISHNISAGTEIQLDKNQKLYFNNTIKLSNTDGISSEKNTLLKNDTLLNESVVNRNNSVKSTDVTIEANYELKFAKKGRFGGLSTKIQEQTDESTSKVQTHYTQYINSDTVNKFIDQNFVNTNNTKTYKLSGTYIEPLIKQNLFLELNLNVLDNSHLSRKNTFTKSNTLNEDYNLKIDSLSNNYDYNARVYSEKAKLNLQLKKWTFNAGLKLQHSTMNQLNLDKKDVVTTRNFNNLLPELSMNWNYKRNSNFKVSVNKSVTPPSISQIQPLINNANPLFINEGNPNLVPVEKYNFKISNNFWRAVSQSSLWASINFNLIQKDIVNSTDYLENGVTKQKYVQTDGNYRLNFQCYYGFKLKKLDLGINPGISSSYNKTNNFINNIENINKNLSVNPYLYVSKEIDSLFSFTYIHNLSLNKSTLYNQSTKEVTQWNMSNSVEMTLFLPLKMQFNTELNWNYYPQNNAYSTNTSQWIWNAELSKPIGKRDDLTLKLRVSDILNQNASVNRSFFGNTVNESISQALTRFVMLTATWKFKNKTQSTHGTNE